MHLMQEHEHQGSPVVFPERVGRKRTAKWCKRCSRRHAGGVGRCQFVNVTRISRTRLNKDGTVRRGGHECERLTHPTKPIKKTKARKS